MCVFVCVCVLDFDNVQVDSRSHAQEEHISGGEVSDPSLPDQGIPAIDGEASMGKVEDAAVAEDIQTTIIRKLYQHTVVYHLEPQCPMSYLHVTLLRMLYRFSIILPSSESMSPDKFYDQLCETSFGAVVLTLT